jgi:DNA-directed RNA polymerase specialized sigma24 family protein
MTARIIRFHVPDAPRDDAQIQDELDDLVTRAGQGDRIALTAMAVAFGARLLKEARLELGRFKEDAEHVLQDFFLAVIEGVACFDPQRERAPMWMEREVRKIARRHRAERERDRGVAAQRG